MPNFEDVAVKRAENQTAKQQETQRRENINAVENSGREVVSSTQSLAKSQDIDSLLKQMKELALAQYVNGQNTIKNNEKPTIVLRDQTDLGSKLQDMADKFAATVSQLNSSDIDNKQLKSLAALITAIENMNKELTADSQDDAKRHKELLKAIRGLDLSPVVNVPEVKLPKLDLSPVTNVLKEFIPAPAAEYEDKIDLDCYRAQDLYETGDTQYVGFVNPDGDWYIIENKIKENQLRYIFGDQDYAKAFKDASTYQYLLLNEAVDALQA